MSQFIPHSPELDQAFGTLHLRQDLINQCITIGIKRFNDWDIDTKEVQISPTVIHFVQPDGELVGIKVLSISTLDKKFQNVPVEKDTTILVSINLKFGEFDAHYEKWFWDGLYGKTLVFFNDDIQDTTVEELKTELIDSTFAKAGGEITVKRTDEYTFFNFNFTDDEDE